MLITGAIFIITLAVLSSPILIRNLNLFDKPLYTPLPSLRLAERYADPELNAWRWVHFDGPVTVRELVSLHGKKWVIRKEIEIWIKVIFKVFLLNIFLTLLILRGMITDRKKLNWKPISLAFLLMIEPLFSALYWRQETRYLWPIYPSQIFIFGLIFREFFSFDRSSNKKSSPPEFKSYLYAMLLLILVQGLTSSGISWKSSVREARKPSPGWSDRTRQTPSGSVIITNDPWSTAWYSERYAVMCPIGSHDDLLKVIEIYKPDYYLDTGTGFKKAKPSFSGSELELIAKGSPGEGEWLFYKVRIPGIQ